MKIIYIISAGRSGSTILDILLGNGEGILSCGELNRYAAKQGMPTYWCKFENSPTFLFWNNIKIKLLEKLNSDFDFYEMSKINRKFEFHHSQFNPILKKDEFDIYKEFNLKLYETILNNSKHSIIVDSSKYPVRALRLADAIPYEMCFIYLKRDPRGVIKSFLNKDIPQPSKGWFMANIYYFAINTLCKSVVNKLNKHHAVVEIKYEDIIENPIDTLYVIQEALNINLEPTIQKIIAGASLNIGPLFAGNRIRAQKSIVLETKPILYSKSLKNSITRYLNFYLYR